MIDESAPSSSAKVQTLIERFELMARANASGNNQPVTRAPASSPNSAVKEMIDKMNQRKSRMRAQSEPVPMFKLEPTPEMEPISIEKPQPLTVKTVDIYEGDSDESTKSIYSSTNYCSTVPRSPSAYSTASTGSLDSLLSSLDIFLPDLRQATGDVNHDNTKLAKPATHTRRSSLPENARPVASKLVQPRTYRRASIASKSPAMPTKDTSAKTRRSSKTATQALSAIAKPRRSSLTAVSAPPAAKPSRRFSASARSAPPVEISSPRARARSESTSAPRYLNYNQSPRFAATKAMNLERRRQLQERSRNEAADKAKHVSSKTARRPRSPEWQNRLDQVKSRLFDFRADPQWSGAANSKTTAVRKSSSSSRARV